MKPSHLIAIFVCLFLYSCQTDTELLIEGQEPNQEDILLSQAARGGDTEYDTFESTLQWAAFISAKVYLHDKNARNEVIDLLDNKTVLLEKLIGNNIADSYFETAFRRELARHHGHEYHRDDNDTSTAEEQPAGGIRVCCARPGTLEELITNYINFLIYDNCIELYIPNLCQFNHTDDIVDITSTGHPLTEANENHGFIRYPEPHRFEDGVTGYTNKVHVDPRYINSVGLTFVVRPVREPKKPKCEYRDYYGIDFTAFLRNE